MKLVLKLITGITVIIQVSACSWLFGDDGTFRDRSNDYRQAKVETPLVLPAGIDSESLDDSYAIPPISDRTSLDEKFIIPRPEALSEDVERDTVRINTLGDQRWILVDGAPGQVWPRLRGFLSLNQLTVQRADATSGMLETAWLQPSGENALRERYRLRIEQGVQRGSSEVYVLQADLRAGTDSWPKSSSSEEREKIMTESLAQYLADSAAAASVSMLAQQAIDSSGKVTLEEDANAIPFIKLKLNFSRAWPSLGRALEKAEFSIDDLNRDEKLYYVHYLDNTNDEEEEDGFFSWLWNWGKSTDTDKTDLGIPYFIRMTPINDTTVSITIERQNGAALDNKQTTKILKLIKKHIA
ncbi:outer membrane protein assembly factor BamC [Oceanicoccus sp. KOV_DT_Chl]|uniref:outer membrane protein assembly factor BamC n=1 Tax=Oceanicoccus sp. KOV_DT_Chl TaxID=1904639 RepID=UPI000C7C2DF5|nr:outer membrane protein assembly factor BamC [Oceanicoccus sp. KOV_DT_Chl]